MRDQVPPEPPPAETYPPYVVSPDDKLRWDMAAAIAEALFGGVGSGADVWQATRSIYHSDLPT